MSDDRALTGPTPKDQAAGFAVTDEKSAAWLLRKLRAIDEEQDAIKAATAQRVAELDADYKRLTHLYLDQLTAWARDEAAKRRRKTITVPLAGAAISFRTVPAKLEIHDTQAAADTATVLGLVTTAADLAAYRRAAVEAMESRGELLPGCRMGEEKESISIRRLSGKDNDQAAG